MKTLILGAGELGRRCHDAVGEITTIDIRELPEVDIVHDLNQPFPIDNDTFDVVIGEHVAEHVPNRIQFLRECARVLKPGGLLVIEVPNWSHILSHGTLEHCSTWARNIFDEDYITRSMRLKKERLEYRVQYPFMPFSDWRLGNEFLGRVIDRLTTMVSGLRFYLRKT